MTKSISAHHCDAYLSEMASVQPSPGGGAAAALSGATAAALVSMVCRLTLASASCAGSHAALSIVLARADELRGHCLTLADDDAREAAKMVGFVHQCAAAPESERAGLTAEVQTALHAAAGTVMAILQACVETLTLSETAARLGIPVALSDVGVGARLAAAGAAGAALMVGVNLDSITDPQFVAQYRVRAEELLVQARQLEADVCKLAG